MRRSFSVRGFALTELLITLVIVSTTISASVRMLSSHQRTTLAIMLSAGTTEVALSARQHLASGNGNSIADLSGFNLIGNDTGHGPVAGAQMINIGSAMPEVEIVTHWTALPRYSDGVVFSGGKLAGAPAYPLLKQGEITVSWKDDEGDTKTFSLPFSRPHPILNASAEKLLKLNSIAP